MILNFKKNIYLHLILKKYLFFIIIISTLMSIILMLPQYYIFLSSDFLMFSKNIDVFKFFIFKFPGYFCDSSIYIVYFSIFIIFFYIYNSNLKKRIDLASYNLNIYKYMLLFVTFIIIISVFFLKQFVFLDFDFKANKLLYKDKVEFSYNFPIIYMGDKGILYSESYVKTTDEEHFSNVVLDMLENNDNPEIIFSKEGKLVKNKIILKEGFRNIINDPAYSSKFDALELEFKIKSDQNLLLDQIFVLSIIGINKIEQSNNLYNTDIIKLLKRSRIITFINNLIFIILIFIICFQIKSKNIFYYLIIYTIVLFFYLLVEFKIKNYFLNLSLKNGYYIIFEFIFIIFIGIIIKFGLFLYKKHEIYEVVKKK